MPGMSTQAAARDVRRVRAGTPGRGLAAAVLLALLLPACGDTGFVGRRVDNFTAFYNTFHNATVAYDKGVEQISDRERPVDRSVYLSLFLQPPEGGSTAESFEKAINKSADVLREHPTSKWVDDALLLIGKAYYFQGNDVGAEQKFREVIDLESSREGEARFWLARTLVTSGQFDEASEQLNASLADEENDFGTWTDRMRLARAGLFVRQERWAEAGQALQRGLDGDLPDELEARAAYLLGQVRETEGRYREAVAAYERARGAASRYELAFASEMNAIRTLGLAGEPASALDRLRDAEGDNKNYDKRFDIRVLKGRLQHRAGRPKEAKRTLRGILYGDETPRGTVKGRAHHALGVLYRDGFTDFSTAAAHFDTAATTLQPPAENRDRRRSPAAVTDSRDLADRYGTLAETAQTVARLDSLIRLGELPDEEFRAFVAELRAQRRAEQEAAARTRQEQAVADRFRSRGAQFQDANRRGGGFAQTQAAATQSSESGFLFHQNAARVQEGKRSFERTWGRRPLVDNWRRIEAIRGQQDESTPAAETQPSPRSQPRPDAATPAAGIDVSAVPRTPEQLAEARTKRARARYELGNALFLAANRPDSAATWYQTILEESGETDVARQALYALAEVRRAQGRTGEARRLYRRLLDWYPDSRFAERARSRLGESASRTAQVDSTARAKAAYRRAYRDWSAGRLDAALAAMAETARDHPQAPAAPKALLASAMIYLEQRRDGSSDLRPDRLLALASALRPADDSTGSTPPPAPGVAGPGADEADARTDASPGGVSPTNASAPNPASTARDGDRQRPPEEAAPEEAATRSGSSGDRSLPVRPVRAGEDEPDPDPTTAPPTVDSVRTADPGSARPTAPPADSSAADSAATDSAATDSAAATAAGRVDPIAADSAAADSSRSLSSTAQSDELEPVRAVLRVIAARYAETPQAERARAMLAAMQPAPPSDAAPADTASAPAARSTPGRARPDPDSATVRPAEPSPQPDAAGRMEPSPGPWTLVLGPFPNRAAARQQQNRLQTATDRRHPVRVRPARDSSTFQVALGRFGREDEARSARRRMDPALADSVAIERVPDGSARSAGERSADEGRRTNR